MSEKRSSTPNSTSTFENKYQQQQNKVRKIEPVTTYDIHYIIHTLGQNKGFKIKVLDKLNQHIIYKEEYNEIGSIKIEKLIINKIDKIKFSCENPRFEILTECLDNDVELINVVSELKDLGYIPIIKAGGGTQGNIYITIYKIEETNEIEIRAIKIEQITDENRFSCVVKNLLNTDDPSLVKMYESIVNNGYSCLIMEYIKYNLSEVFKSELEEHKEWMNNLNEEIIIQLTIQLCRGLIELHRRGLIHGDLHHFDNILVRTLNPPEIALADFGSMSSDIKSQEDDVSNLESFIYKLILKKELITNFTNIEKVKTILKNFKASEKFKKLMLHLFEHKDVKVEQILYSLVFDNLKKIPLPKTVIPSAAKYKENYYIDLHLRPEHENIKLLCNLNLSMNHKHENFKKCVGEIDGLQKLQSTPIVRVKLPILEDLDGIEIEKLEESIICTVKLKYTNMKRNSDLIFKGNYTFKPNNNNSTTVNGNDDTNMDIINEEDNNYPFNDSNYSINNNGNYSSYTTTNNNHNNNGTSSNNCAMSYNEFKYKINNYKKEYFNELSKLFKCPLGFSILSHFISMGLKDECIELIKLGYNPNEVDTLNRNSYYWADYYKYDNNEIDSEWLENIYLKYKQSKYILFTQNLYL